MIFINYLFKYFNTILLICYFLKIFSSTFPFWGYGKQANLAEYYYCSVLFFANQAF